MVWWVAAVVAVIAILALYAWWTARRLDRLHARLDAAAAALDEQLVRRAEAAEASAGSAQLALRAAADAALASRGSLDGEREETENELGAAVTDAVEAGPLVAGSQLAELLDQATRAAVARRFYNDTVRDVLVVRDRRVVRWLHLAGRAPLPSYLELDDGVLPPVPQPTRQAGGGEKIVGAGAAET